ncbi:magnesium transporter [Paenibacillus thiaminolyticus]|uniref:magnesium transporter n=1 Tax=Paenibacillus thiaminolyticus TaxID=49283 RepID=UPI0011621D42|nr:magnesium transporter [Paenibacillus thiaminolyticus]MDG0874072.1 magnesium transporter [Paenibacillus thiaminolyticus]NGP58225.1 magnesium transporter [Paenibacillus thiaminolyticus]WCR26716.1 magnesium transporter [Paenibacillus thiaminolyticus]
MSRQQTNDPNEAVSGGREPEDIMAEAIQILEGDEESIRHAFRYWHPYDLALVYRDAMITQRSRLLEVLDVDQLTGIMRELDPALQLESFQMLGHERAAEVLNRMDNDDLADTMAAVSVEAKEFLLSLMKREERDTVRQLLTYEPETAGGLMTNRYVWFYQRYTVREAVEKVKAFAELTKHVHYFYVVNEEKRLVGTLAYRELVLAQETETIQSLMNEKVISVMADTDQEEVARLFEQYDFLSMPVVDENNRLIGIVTVDDVIDVLREEAHEDFNKYSATDKTIDFRTNPFTAARRRLPWLIMLLFLGLVSGSIISRFEETLQQVVALTFFMPMIAGMTGNTGTQSLAVVIRGLASEKLDKGSVSRLIGRELVVGLIIGTVCGLAVALVAGFWQSSLPLGLVVGSSLFLTVIIGTMAGTVIPLILYRMNADPAVASGPLITTLNDIFSLTVYFGTATLFLSYIM